MFDLLNMAKGGKRPGAGRPVESHTLLKLEMRRALVERAHKEMEALYDAQFALALGYWRVIEDPNGNPIKVYKKAPNGEALGYLLDQVIDKAIQHVDVEGHTEVEQKLSAEQLAELKQAVAYALPQTKNPGKKRSQDIPKAG